MNSTPFRRIVITGVENAGKSTLANELSQALGWPCIPEAARQHADVLKNRIDLGTFDELHEIQTERAAKAARDGHEGVICDTGDLILKVWSDVLGLSWHPLTPPWPPVDLYILCPTLETWEPDPLRSMPEYEDRLALEKIYLEHLMHRPHLVAEGQSAAERCARLVESLPW
ncbi:MAG: ATP-binding protein [Bacteroidetes bacterium]|nr:ATP-binding protein [Bacteroidota bacterium]MDA0904051.1 ATP-binding protein [Bacteroidota bacterium]MDA1242707.1 ATP-binding protein [Bacteroidota bacterium]